MPPNRNNYHGPKRQLLGNNAGHAAPAWRTPGSGPGGNGTSSLASGAQQQQGSKIFLSRLPMDVGEAEVEELFRKTVGPVKEVFLVYNSQGSSKGMAVVTFHRPGDAMIARQKYDGKIVDGRRPIKIEIIYDGVPNKPSLASAPSLLARIAPPAPVTSTQKAQQQPTIPNLPSIKTAPPRRPRHPKAAPVASKAAPAAAARPPPSTSHTRAMTTTTTAATTQAVFIANSGGKKYRVKKGPKRVKKRFMNVHKSKEQLDMDMEEYNNRKEMDEGME